MTTRMKHDRVNPKGKAVKRGVGLILALVLCLTAAFAVSADELIQEYYVRSFVSAARKAYRQSEYADYTTSIIGQKDADGKYIYRNGYRDRAYAVTLTWDELSETGNYTLFVSTASNFPNDDRTVAYENIETTTYKLINLESATTYYWKAVRGTAQTPVSSFATNNSVRFLTVDGINNVRDIGGWNGLNRSLAYRGTEMNGTTFALTDKGKATMRDVLKIRTDLDLRSAGSDSYNTTESPLGTDINFVITGIQPYLGAFSGTAAYRQTMEVFADRNNYPIYFHCQGGADRTGTVACLIEALCGAAEEDLSIDFELTSFSKVGFRYRYDDGSRKFASFMAQFKSCPGDTLAEKAANYLYETLGMREAQIANIRSIMGGNGVSFENTEDLVAGRTNRVFLRDCDGKQIAEVTQNGKQIPWTLSEGTLSLSPRTEGKGEITFADGTALTFEAVAPVEPEPVEEGALIYNEDFRDRTDAVTALSETLEEKKCYLNENGNISLAYKNYGTYTRSWELSSSALLDGVGKYIVSAKVRPSGNQTDMGAFSIAYLDQMRFRIPLRMKGDSGTSDIKFYDVDGSLTRTGVQPPLLDKDHWYRYTVIYDFRNQKAKLTITNEAGTSLLTTVEVALKQQSYSFTKALYLRWDPSKENATDNFRQCLGIDDFTVTRSLEREGYDLLWHEEYEDQTTYATSIAAAEDETTGYLREKGNLSALSKCFGNDGSTAMHRIYATDTIPDTTIPKTGVVEIEAQAKFSSNATSFGNLRPMQMGSNQGFRMQVIPDGGNADKATVAYYDKGKTKQPTTGSNVGTFAVDTWYLFREIFDFDNKTITLQIYDTTGRTLKAEAASVLSDDLVYSNPQFRIDYSTAAGRELALCVDNWAAYRKLGLSVENADAYEVQKSNLVNGEFCRAQGDAFDYYAMRFLFRLNLGENDTADDVKNCGAYLIPWDVLQRDGGELSDSSPRLVRYPQPSFAEGAKTLTFAANLLGVPKAAVNRSIYVVPYVNDAVTLQESYQVPVALNEEN